MAVGTVFRITISSYFFLKETQGDRFSLPSDIYETCETLRGIGSQQTLVDLERISNEVEQTDWQFLEEMEERPGEAPQVAAEQGKGDLAPEQETTESEEEERTDEKKVSYNFGEKEEGVSKGSLVSTTTEDSLFQKDESIPVYPLVSVKGIFISLVFGECGKQEHWMCV